jgi:hypothetical protein
MKSSFERDCADASLIETASVSIASRIILVIGRRRAENATHRLLDLIATGSARLTRVACACPPGQEGSRNCNYGRLCGSLTIGGRDVGQILIGEGLARSYACGTTSCPRRRPWC